MRRKYVDIYDIKSFNSKNFNIDLINLDKILFQNKIWKLGEILYLYKAIKYNADKKVEEETTMIINKFHKIIFLAILNNN